MLSPIDLENIQINHYGKVRIQGKILTEWIENIHNQQVENVKNIYLPIPREQLYMWGDGEKLVKPKVHLFYN